MIHLRRVLLFVLALFAPALLAGGLRITISPTAAVTAGAQWRVDGGAWRNNGVTVSGLASGTHKVELKPVAGWIPPAGFNLSVPRIGTATRTVSYVRAATATVTLVPANAQWRIDGGAWTGSGGTVSGITPGFHTISYGAIAGYSAPANETVSLTAGQNLSVSRSYMAQFASLSVTLNPTEAQWRAFPAGSTPTGNWIPSGGTAAQLTAGSYQIEYQALADYVAPPSEVVVVAPGADTAFSRAYTFDPAFGVVHSFFDAGGSPTIIRSSDGRFYGVTGLGGAMGGGSVFSITGDGAVFTILKSFRGESDGLSPSALVEGTDGVLYGTTSNGGEGTNNGTVFRINRDGSDYRILRSFVNAAEGSMPNSLIEGSDGILYGTTILGSSNQPRIFRLNHDGSGFAVLQLLPASCNPRGLTEGAGGLLYGVNQSSGSASVGSVFILRKDGTGFATLKSFAGGSDGATPAARLTIDNDGWLYGTTRSGGASNRGLVYRMAPDGSAYTVLHHFIAGATDGGMPYAQLSLDGNQTLFGTAFMGGPANFGSLFRINRDGSGYATVRFFTGDVIEGGRPNTRTISLDATHMLCATNFGAGANSGALLAVDLTNGSSSVLLGWGAPNGNLPMGPVTLANNGKLYGTTYSGGQKSQGTLYSINPDGSEHRVLHHFMGATDGSRPRGRLLASIDGSIYGTASGGGASNSGCLFKTALDGSIFAVVHSFVSSSEGIYPQGITEGSDARLYGVTSAGGNFDAGTVFRIERDGAGYTILHHFAGGTSDGKTPYSALLEGADGRLYGTTSAGGTADVGTIFSVNRDGTGYMILRHFTGGTIDGSTPWGDLIQGTDGALYGTTNSDVVNPLVTLPNGLATVFKINPDGSGYSILKSFDYAAPYYSGVIEHNGRLYGTCADNGTFNGGTLFSMGTDGSDFDVLINFGAGATDPVAPPAGVTCSPQGILYGTTAYGANGGTIFRMRLD